MTWSDKIWVICGFFKTCFFFFNNNHLWELGSMQPLASRPWTPRAHRALISLGASGLMYRGLNVFSPWLKPWTNLLTDGHPAPNLTFDEYPCTVTDEINTIFYIILDEIIFFLLHLPNSCWLWNTSACCSYFLSKTNSWNSSVNENFPLISSIFVQLLE